MRGNADWAAWVAVRRWSGRRPRAGRRSGEAARLPARAGSVVDGFRARGCRSAPGTASCASRCSSPSATAWPRAPGRRLPAPGQRLDTLGPDQPDAQCRRAEPPRASARCGIICGPFPGRRRCRHVQDPQPCTDADDAGAQHPLPCCSVRSPTPKAMPSATGSRPSHAAAEARVRGSRPHPYVVRFAVRSGD